MCFSRTSRTKDFESIHNTPSRHTCRNSVWKHLKLLRSAELNSQLSCDIFDVLEDDSHGNNIVTGYGRQQGFNCRFINDDTNRR